jgi:hypothetical protein
MLHIKPDTVQSCVADGQHQQLQLHTTGGHVRVVLQEHLMPRGS